MKIGIRGHDLPGAPFVETEDLVKELVELDIDALQLVYKKAFKDFDMNPHTLLKLADELKNANKEVAMVGAYFNMIHPDLNKRDEGKEYFKWCMETAFIYDCHVVGSETGSANGDKWTFNPVNHTEESYETVLKTVKELKKYGHTFKCRPIIEGAYAHTIYNPDLLKKLIDETEISDVTFDIYNYLNEDNYKDRDKIFEDGVKKLKDYIKVFHIKDFNVIDGKLVQCAISDGIIDWKKYLPIIKENCPDAYLVLEGVTGKDNIVKSVNYLRRIINE